MSKSKEWVIDKLKEFLSTRVEENKKAYQQLEQEQGFSQLKDFGDIVGY